MFEQRIENFISEVLTGDAQKNALEFASFLRANKMLFERGTGYWDDKLYFMIKYRKKYVCFILIGDSERRGVPWTVWSDTSDSSDSQWYKNAQLDERMKTIALKNIDLCGNCSPGSPCYGGIRKTIFAKEFNHICRTTFRFDNPDNETLEFIKKNGRAKKKRHQKKYLLSVIKRMIYYGYIQQARTVYPGLYLSK